MKIANYDLDRNVLVVAEIGNNHEGSYPRAVEMIGRAAEAGANAVKFQTIIPERLVAYGQAARMRQLRKLCLPWQTFPKLKKVADREGVLFLSTPFDLESAAFLNPLVPAFKIASGDNNFFPLIHVLAKFNKPLLLSTGMCERKDIGVILTALRKIWDVKTIQGNLCLLHCVTSYPVPPNEANLKAILFLSKYRVTVGYSDHTLGIQAPVAAVALGARIIEKHFTLNRNLSDFRDHKLAATPADFKMMVERIREAELLLGDGRKRIMPCEKDNVLQARRSIAAAIPLRKGIRLNKSHLTWLRPGCGFRPGAEHEITGKILLRNIPTGEIILQDYLRR